MAGRNPYLIARFWAKVDVGNWGQNQCWPWHGGANKNGYGRFKIATGKLVSPHVFAYEYFFGTPVEHDGYHGTVIRHTCDNPRCCNPAHLRAGTQLENVEDMDRKRRRGHHRPGTPNQWHKLDVEKVRDIKMRLAKAESPTRIAQVYNVAPSTIRQIRDGRIWKSA